MKGFAYEGGMDGGVNPGTDALRAEGRDGPDVALSVRLGLPVSCRRQVSSVIYIRRTCNFQDARGTYHTYHMRVESYIAYRMGEHMFRLGYGLRRRLLDATRPVLV